MSRPKRKPRRPVQTISWWLGFNGPALAQRYRAVYRYYGPRPTNRAGHESVWKIAHRDYQVELYAGRKPLLHKGRKP